MSVGSALLNPENLELVRKTSWKLARPRIVEQGLRYYEEHPEEVDQIRSNLRYIGLPDDGAALDETLRQIVVHYFEKLFALVKRYEIVWIVRNRVELGDGFERLREAQASGKGVFIAESHFGGTYILPGLLMANGFETHMVARFPKPVLELFESSIQAAVERYGCSRLRILNVLDPTADIPFQMIRLLKTGGVVSNVFDEPNQFSRRVTLLGRPIIGGSGMDRILGRFDDDQVLVASPFVIRTSEETFRLEIDLHSLSDGKLLESLYGSLERRIRAYPEQWFFIHELHHAIPADASGP